MKSPEQHLPKAVEMTREQAHERLRQIDAALFALTESLNRIPAKFQESTHGDDDATESESAQQELAFVRNQIEELRHESAEITERLSTLQKAA